MGDVDHKVLKETQELLGKYVKKPQLTEKLLQKPPFRFLHDVVKVVINETGFLAGLFTSEELNYENVKEKDAKLVFLSKLIAVVKLTCGKNLTVKASKIVAGQEADKTNELLQAIAYCVDQKIDAKEAIELYTNNSKKVEKKLVKNKTLNGSVQDTANKNGSNSTKKESQRNTIAIKKNEPKTISNSKNVPSKTKKLIGKKENDEPKKNKTIERQKTITIKESSLDKNMSEKSLLESNTSDKVLSNEENAMESKLNETDFQQPIKTPLEMNDASITVEKENSMLEELKTNQDLLETNIENKERNSDLPVSLKEPFTQNSIDKADISKDSNENVGNVINIVSIQKNTANLDQLNESSKIEATIQKKNFRNIIDEKVSTLRQPSARPPSARPGAPKRKDKSLEALIQPELSQNARNKHDPSLEIFGSELDDNIDNLIVIEDSELKDDFHDMYQKGTQDGNEGHLVQQILESQQKFNVAGVVNSTESGPWESLMDSHRVKSAKTDILRNLIQALTKSINPLGNLLDFIQEDFDAMQIELTHQKDLHLSSAFDLEKEKALSEAGIKTLKQQLRQLQDDIKLYKVVIHDTKCNILTNEQKIYKTTEDL